MKAVGKYLFPLKQAVRTDDYVFIVGTIADRTCADAHIGLALAHFETGLA